MSYRRFLSQSGRRGAAATQTVVVSVVVGVVALGGIFLIVKSRSGKGKAPPVVQVPADAPPPAEGLDKPPAKPVPPAEAASPGGLKPAAPSGDAAALLLKGDELYQKHFAGEAKDRAQWEAIREAYSAALLTADPALENPELRKSVVAKLNELNKFLLFSKMKTTDCVIHEVKPGESYEKIAMAYGLPRDCQNSLYWINGKVKSEKLQPGDNLKVIKPLKMEIRISKKHLRLTAFLNGVFFGEFPVSIGKDDGTPAGEFVVKNGGKDKNPDWTKTGPDGLRKVYKFGDPENILGTRWIGLEDKPDAGATGLGIHGTTMPDSIGKRVSAGCIRMHNADVELLYDFTPASTKVVITDQ